MTTFTISLYGVPVGVVEFAPTSDFIAIAVRPLGGYDAIRATVRAASIALADSVIGRTPGGSDGVALRDGAELGRMLELRDRSGVLVPTDFIELTEWPGGSPELAAMIRFQDAHAAVPARVRVPSVGASDARSPGPDAQIGD